MNPILQGSLGDLFVFEIGFPYIAQADLQLQLPQPPECWNHRCTPPVPAFTSIFICLLFLFCLALKASPSKKRCNSIAALKATSQEIVSSISQEWKDEKHDLLTEGQSFSSLDEEGKDCSFNKKKNSNDSLI
jgi:1-phosphatidylinositol-4-phosphate 5-kinase